MILRIIRYAEVNKLIALHEYLLEVDLKVDLYIITIGGHHKGPLKLQHPIELVGTSMESKLFRKDPVPIYVGYAFNF